MRENRKSNTVKFDSPICTTAPIALKSDEIVRYREYIYQQIESYAVVSVIISPLSSPQPFRPLYDEASSSHDVLSPLA